MRLTPLDIKKQEFERVFRGFDPEETRAFLDMVAQQWQEVLDEQRRLEDQVRALEGKLDHYQKVEEALQEALETARSSSQQRLENAKERAANIEREANARAHELTREAEQRRERMEREAEQIGRRRDEVVARLRGFLGSELELLDRFEDDALSPADRAELSGGTERASAERHDVARKESTQGEVSGDPYGEEPSTSLDDAAGPDDRAGEDAPRAAWKVESLLDQPAAREEPARPPQPSAHREADDEEPDEEETLSASSEELDKIRRILSDLD